jgi:hypothetical protein
MLLNYITSPNTSPHSHQPESERPGSNTTSDYTTSPNPPKLNSQHPPPMSESSPSSLIPTTTSRAAGYPTTQRTSPSAQANKTASTRNNQPCLCQHYCSCQNIGAPNRFTDCNNDYINRSVRRLQYDLSTPFSRSR